MKVIEGIEKISESVLDDDSSEVATTISGYIAKNLLQRSKCNDCENKLTFHDQDLQNDQYLVLLSRGCLFVPPKELAEFVCSCFEILEVISYLLAKSLDLQCIFRNTTGPSVNSVANTI